MSIFNIAGGKLLPIREVKVDLELYIHKLTNSNAVALEG